MYYLHAAGWFVAGPWCSSDAMGTVDLRGWLGLVGLFTKHVELQLMRLAWAGGRTSVVIY